VRYAAFGATLVVATLYTGTSFSPPIFPEQEIQARFFAAVPPHAAPAAPAAAARAPEPSLDPGLFRGEPGLPISRMMDLGVRTILIDPGHGGDDTGALGRSGTREKEVALDIAHRLKRRLEAGGRFDVLLTRDGDTTLPLQERVAIAHASHADLFVSVHLNFLPSRPINIIETFYFGPRPTPRARSSPAARTPAPATG